jgi:hypothetical protein
MTVTDRCLHLRQTVRRAGLFPLLASRHVTRLPPVEETAVLTAPVDIRAQPFARAKALENADHRAPSLKAQLARLDDLSAELRRIAAKAAAPEMKRDAESLAAFFDEARRRFEDLSA